MLSNFNPSTGIHYGVISIHSVSSWFLDDIYQNGTDNIFEGFIKELKEQGKTEEEIQNEIDVYDSCGYTDITYTDSEYDIWLNESTIFVSRSPVIVKCRPCSPCCPNAGDLDNLDPDNGISSYGLKPEDLYGAGE
jgi:hypothetical protein